MKQKSFYLYDEEGEERLHDIQGNLMMELSILHWWVTDQR